MNLPDHIHPIAVDDALLNIGMTINEIRALTGDPAPQIIRTVEELEALDPDTVVERRGTIFRTARNAINVAGHWGIDAVLPAVVIREGAEVRAARKALWEA